MLVKSILLLMSVFGSPTIVRQKPPLIFDRIPREHGLTQSNINCIYQDRRGFIWVATQDGLKKYDGYHFSSYTHRADDPTTISNNFVWYIYEDQSNVMWLATRDGLNRFDQATDSFYSYQHQPEVPDSLSTNHVRILLEDRHGIFWVGTRGGGLHQFDRKTGVFVPYVHHPEDPHSLSHQSVECLFEDRFGHLWVGTLGGGLNQFDRENGQFNHFQHSVSDHHSLSSDTIWSIFEDREGILWIGTSDGLNRFDRANQKFTRFQSNHDVNSLSNNDVRTIWEDRSNNMWVGTYGGGLNLFNRKDEVFHHYNVELDHPRSLINNNVRYLYEDRAGVLWVGTGGGLCKSVPNKARFSLYCDVFMAGTDSSNRSVSAFFEDNQDKLWIGGVDGLKAFDSKTGTFFHYKHQPQSLNSLKPHRIRSITGDKRGILWVGTWGGGLSRLDPRTKTFEHFTHQPDEPDSLSSNYVWFIHMDRFGILWAGTNTGGIHVMDPEAEFIDHYLHDPSDPQSLSSNNVKTVCEDKNGFLWFGTSGGLNRFDRSTKKFKTYKHSDKDLNSLSNNIVKTIFEDHSGNLWIGTFEGLNKFNPLHASFIHYGKKDGLPSDVIYGILEDRQDYLWLSTNRGLSKFNPKTGTYRNFDRGDGLQGDEFGGDACFQNKKGELFFGGRSGFNAFNPQEITDNPFVPQVVITSFKKFFQEAPLDRHISEIQELNLSYKDSMISFEFASLCFSEPSKNQFAYVLEGLSDEWVTMGNKHDVDFTLSPGKYVLKVKGSNNRGIWNENGTTINIDIQPPFWETLWFKLLVVLLIMAVSYFLVHLSKKYLTLIAFWKKKHYVGHYKIIDEIASGGMGIVYKSVDLINRSQTVAIKVIRDELSLDTTQRKRFINEATIIDQLDHPNIVKVLERGEQQNSLYLVMEYLEGQTLAEKIKNDMKLPMADMLEIAIQLVNTVERIHQKGIIHRDLKPDNIMLIQKNNSNNFVKLLDFGLANAQNLTRLTEYGIIVGTINYISPEQISGVVNTSSDLYSLGIIFYEMVTGTKPFLAESSIDVINQILSKEPVEPICFRPDLPKPLNTLIVKMLSKTSDSRPGCLEILTVLDQMQKELEDI